MQLVEDKVFTGKSNNVGGTRRNTAILKKKEIQYLIHKINNHGNNTD